MRRDEALPGAVPGVGMNVPDLGALGRKDLELTPEQMAEGEVQAGLRCSVCQRRFTDGVEVVKLLTQFHPQMGLVGMIGNAYCCEQEDCRDAVVDETAVAVRPIQQLFLTPDPLPNPKAEEVSDDGGANMGAGSGVDGAAQGGT